MKRVLVLCGVLVALAALSPARARAALPTTCTGTQVAYVSMTVPNEQVTGADGHVWATASYTRQVIIRRYNAFTFCAMTQDSGTFTTIAGVSPGGTGIVSDGITGPLSRSTRTDWFTARWAPSVATSGSIGVVDASTPWTSLFFSGTVSFSLTWEARIYQTSGHGCIAYRLDRGGWYAGDIVG